MWRAPAKPGTRVSYSGGGADLPPAWIWHWGADTPHQLSF
jgi:hypothetical protein